MYINDYRHNYSYSKKKKYIFVDYCHTLNQNVAVKRFLPKNLTIILNK